MILHLCRLAWNRRRTNLLLVGELTLVFVIVAFMGVGWVLFAVESMESPGFEYEDVWSVNLARHEWMRDPGEEQSSDFGRTVTMVRRELEALGAVESVAIANQSPFEGLAFWNGIAAVSISQEGLETLGLRLESGRWFDPEDEALSGNRTPVVMDRPLSRALFGDQDPLGKTIDQAQIREKYGLDGYVSINMASLLSLDLLVVGVVEDCLYYGKYGSSERKVPGTLFLFLPDTRVNTFESYGGVHLLLKTPSRRGADFGEELRNKVRAIVPADQAMRFDVRSLAEIHDRKQAGRLQGLKSTALISSLLMLMVALGLSGILWQAVRRRTREIGVRRAVGAAGGNVYALFLGELAVLATAAVALGCVPILHFDLLSLVLHSWIPIHIAMGGLAAAALVLHLLVLLCGLYPSWLAARVRPAEALHHE